MFSQKFDDSNVVVLTNLVTTEQKTEDVGVCYCTRVVIVGVYHDTPIHFMFRVPHGRDAAVSTAT